MPPGLILTFIITLRRSRMIAFYRIHIGRGDCVRRGRAVHAQLHREVPPDLHHRLRLVQRAEVRDHLQEELPHHLQANGESVSVALIRLTLQLVPMYLLPSVEIKLNTNEK